MKTNNLNPREYIAFGFNYNGGEHDEIIVTNITSKHSDGYIVHFMYGHHSLSEHVLFEDIIAIGNPDGKTKINGWGGKFDLVKESNLI